MRSPHNGHVNAQPAAEIRRRPLPADVVLPADLPSVLSRLYRARGVTAEEISLELPALLPPQGLMGIDIAARLLADEIAANRRIVIAGDYDCDGATGCAVAVLGLSALGARHIGYAVPDRFLMGYGLSPLLVEMIHADGAELIVTVDNGIASVEGVARAKALGMGVIITDHHLPGAELPMADAIVNPNQPGCTFASKALAGVGVMFYLLLALRAEMRRRGVLATEPHLASLLDLVALGTVADLARLDHNNRILVEQGLRRIRADRARPGVMALLQVAGREARHISATDLGFVLGPRLNAAGRLDDMRAGIDCLLADSLSSAAPLAQVLDKLNRERRSLTTDMGDMALDMTADHDAIGIAVFDESWHEGIVGLVASRLKEAHHRPAVAFACAAEIGMLKGSARSIAGLNVRDVLAAIDAQQPGMILRFGGHAMAAGLSLRQRDFSRFAAAFEQQCRAVIAPAALLRVLETDGELSADELTPATATLLEQAGPWGQGFPEPAFEGRFAVLAVKLMGNTQQHVRYQLRSTEGVSVEAVDFGGAERAPSMGSMVKLVYVPGVNRYNGRETLQLRVLAIEPLVLIEPA